MATIQLWTQTMHERLWTEEEKAEWIAAHGGEPTHVVTFEPMYQLELCIPPWEHPDRHVARSAVAWGTRMVSVFTEESLDASPVVAAHHEGNSLEIYPAFRTRPRLHRIV